LVSCFFGSFGLFTVGGRRPRLPLNLVAHGGVHHAHTLGSLNLVLTTI